MASCISAVNATVSGLRGDVADEFADPPNLSPHATRMTSTGGTDAVAIH